MPFRYLLKKGRHVRFERFNIVVSILLAGWVPSILTVWFSYTFLTKMLESRILRDRQTFVQLISRLVGDDLSRTQGIIDYYQTLPDVSRILNSSNPQSTAQQWLGTTFYSHPRIDGMFLTGRDGRLIASIPHNPAMIGKDFESNLWRVDAEKISGAFVSPVHARFPAQFERVTGTRLDSSQGNQPQPERESGAQRQSLFLQPSRIDRMDRS